MIAYQIDLNPVHSVIWLTVTAEIMTLETAEEIHTRLASLSSCGGPYSAIFDLFAVKDTTIPFERSPWRQRRPSNAFIRTDAAIRFPRFHRDYCAASLRISAGV